MAQEPKKIEETPKGEGTPSGTPKPFSALSQEERKRRFEELRARMGKSKFEVKGEPGIHYFWAAKDDSNELIRLETLGYSIVKEPYPLEVLSGKREPRIKAAGLRQDGTYVIGDVILTQVEQEVYEFCMLDIEERSEQAIIAAKENFKSEAEKQGAPVFEFSK
jgi:hypothetical protein